MSPLRRFRVLAPVVALLLVTAACGSDEPPALISTGVNPVTAPRDLLATAVDEGFTTLVAAVEATGLTDELEGDDELTLFAPTDDAFEALADGLVPVLLEPANRALLTDILEYHIAEGLNMSADLTASGRVSTLGGGSLTVAEVEEDADEGAEPTTFVQVGGEATVERADLFATNGVIHVIDQVLVPASRADDLDELIASIPEPVDLLSTLEDTGNHGTLLELIDQAGLTRTLDGDGEVTLFAPTDAAFARLTPAQREALDDPELLEAVLRFHVLPRAITTTEVTTQRYLTTLEGQGARLVNVDRGSSFTFGDATITRADIEATNGVIHVIDQVLIPDSVRGPGGL